MRTRGHTTAWGIHTGRGRARDAKSWYEHLKAWWIAHKAMRHKARLAAIAARWDAKREAVTPFQAESAPEMAAAQHAFSTATRLYGLII